MTASTTIKEVRSVVGPGGAFLWRITHTRGAADIAATIALSGVRPPDISARKWRADYSTGITSTYGSGQIVEGALSDSIHFPAGACSYVLEVLDTVRSNADAGDTVTVDITFSGTRTFTGDVIESDPFDRRGFSGGINPVQIVTMLIPDRGDDAERIADEVAQGNTLLDLIDELIGDGAQGAQGGTGAQGASGSTGSQGSTGAQGAQGVTGAQGTQGTTGAQGPGGGAQGAQGAQGAAGAQGTQGLTGPQGAQGAQGVQGATGAQGASGSAGAQGSQGAQGTTGAQGSWGGAVTIPYTFSTTTTDSDPGNGLLRLNQATQNAATVIRADLLDNLGTDWSAVLNTFGDSSSTTKAHIRLVKAGDPTKWLEFTVSALASPSGYKNLTVANAGGSASSPFSNTDSLLLMFSRVGDKGAQGVQGTQGTQGVQGSQGAQGSGLTLYTGVTNVSNGGTVTHTAFASATDSILVAPNITTCKFAVEYVGTSSFKIYHDVGAPIDFWWLVTGH